MNMIITLNIIIGGHIFRYDYFLQTPFSYLSSINYLIIINHRILFSLFFLFGLAMQSLAFFITTLCSNMNVGYTAAYAFLMLGIVMEFFLSNIYVVYLFYLTNSPDWFVIIRFMLSWFPVFSFSKIYGDIGLKSGKHYELLEGRWLQVIIILLIYIK